MRGETDCYGCDDGARADGQWEAEGHFAVFGIWRDFVLQSALTPGGQELATQFTTRLVLFVNAPAPGHDDLQARVRSGQA
ncbi:hypothetical protein PC9H_009153 [Pleurotus ostreatus]|uniref:Uncharacterized protein n=1 Tax=Pleurotus ostreatus TaxID=5322 RepID=A0A8H6ZSM6_PLEOS|nr:uncharacterized protein PC9H_009153 [Pleurotus ostreatus]KAF7426784.1 hypothetical protein PC9H_009153 [Pleurotus ostreatus]